MATVKLLRIERSLAEIASWYGADPEELLHWYRKGAPIFLTADTFVADRQELTAWLRERYDQLEREDSLARLRERLLEDGNEPEELEFLP